MGNKAIQFPPPLKHGDCIGLFLPSGPIKEQEKVEAGRKILSQLGFETYLFPGNDCDHPYLAADDLQRAKEFHAMWANPDIKAMMAVRGGYGCLRLMPFLDFTLLKQSAKLVIGFSDLTVLLNVLADRLNTVTVHGPVITTLSSLDKESIDQFVSLVSGNFDVTRLYPQLEILRSGNSRGILRGGNLTTIAHLIGTPWQISFDKTILVIEDTGEPMYKIDRMLTQLSAGGYLDRVAGILIGNFDNGRDTENNIDLERDVWQRVLELTAKASFPVWGNVPVGHLDKNHALPLGLTVTMESKSQTISYAKTSE